MRRKTVIQLSVAALVAIALILLLAPAVMAGPKQPAYDIRDVGPDLRAQTPTIMNIDLTMPALGSETSGTAGVTSSGLDYTDTKIWLILNDYLGRYQATYFGKVAEGTNCEVWVQLNLAWPAGDPRPTPALTPEQVAYITQQFDAVIYPKDTSYFGMPAFHDGTNAYLPSLLGLPADYYYTPAGKNVILISNIRDDNYYLGPDLAPTYIAGFYSPSFEVYFDRNIISIDAYDWANRLGGSALRPYLYEGVVAHEYQHLLHDDYDPDEETFVNEGCADFAELVCGYLPATQGHIDAAAEFPENSLVLWGDQNADAPGGREILSDYGHAYLWTLYLYEKYGNKFIQAMFHNPDNGISGINSTLAAFHKQKTFADLYHDWVVAMAVNSKTPGGGIYAFSTVPAFGLTLWTVSGFNPEAYDWPGVGPWGTDYVEVAGNPKELAKFTFNGVDYSTFPSAWTVDGGMLWSGTGDLLDNWAIFETAGGGTLSFDTIWDLEDYWDFGFVQVSTDGGHTWTSLADGQGYSVYDCDPNAYPTVVASLPGLTSYITAPVTLTYDLSAYAGQDILVAFRMITDWATSYGGWWIDNVYVDGTLISDGTDASVFKDITEILPINNDFTLTFVGIKLNTKGNAYKTVTMKLDRETESGLLELNKLLKDSTKLVVLVTFDAPEGFTHYTDYTIDFTFTNQGPKK